MVDTVSGSSSGCARHSSLKGVLLYVEISSHSVPVQPAILPLATDDKAAAEFINGIIPQALAEEVSAEIAADTARGNAIDAPKSV